MVIGCAALHLSRWAACSSSQLTTPTEPGGMCCILEQTMDTFRFGRRIKLPATAAIKHQLRMMMADDLTKAEPEPAPKPAEGVVAA
jgi:hypothetical protein